MKKIVALIGIFLLVISCNTEDDEPNVHYELLPIESVVIPDTLLLGDENIITVEYIQPTSCHGFDGFYYEKDGYTRTVAIQSRVIEQDNCRTLTNVTSEQILKFKPTETGTYLFKFWKGKDTNGNDVFEEISIDVQ